MAPRIGDLRRVAEIVIRTSRHTHRVIGTGSGDPQKMDPEAGRETLDHSPAYIVAVALQDRDWHHERSYAPERARRADTVALRRRIRTVEERGWTRRDHDSDPARRAFGGRMTAVLDGGAVVEDEIAVPDAHPLGARPFARADHVARLRGLADDVVAPAERARFLAAAEALPDLPRPPRGIFDR